ncbi:hypothetical protein QTN25_000562 [Entamoeba marina]
MTSPLNPISYFQQNLDLTNTNEYLSSLLTPKEHTYQCFGQIKEHFLKPKKKRLTIVNLTFSSVYFISNETKRKRIEEWMNPTNLDQFYPHPFIYQSFFN